MRIAVVVGTALLVINGTFPLVWMMLTSLKDENELIRIPITYWPEAITFENYVQVFDQLPFARFMLNSAVVSISATSSAC
jgi:multiple sugar transport system permease protein